VPDWLAAIGTLAAFAVAVRLLAKELAVRREAEEDRRTEQARHVSTWTTFPEPDDQDSSLFWFFVVVKNGSEEPVYNVSVLMDEPGSIYAEATGSPTCRMEFFTVAPGESDRPRLRMSEHQSGPLTLLFTDAAGRRWKRYPDGRLEGSLNATALREGPPRRLRQGPGGGVGLLDLPDQHRGRRASLPLRRCLATGSSVASHPATRRARRRGSCRAGRTTACVAARLLLTRSLA
jgi:hypothetical protein